jgi:hypothetical protein
MCLREKIGPDPRNFNQRVSLGRNDLLIRTFPRAKKHKNFKESAGFSYCAAVIPLKIIGSKSRIFS